MTSVLFLWGQHWRIQQVDIDVCFHRLEPYECANCGLPTSGVVEYKLKLIRPGAVLYLKLCGACCKVTYRDGGQAVAVREAGAKPVAGRSTLALPVLDDQMDDRTTITEDREDQAG